MNVLSLFSGIGGFEEGLRRNNINYNLIGYSEINDGYGKAVQDASNRQLSIYREV